MAHFPLFINLEKLPCAVIGGGPVAVRKIQTLLDFGATVIAIASDASDLLEALALEDAVTVLKRPYSGPEDIRGMRLVIAATSDKVINHRVSTDAQALGIPVNVADDPSACTFFFPAIVRRGDLVTGLSSSGHCPRFTARLKEELEEEWPEDWAEELQFLGEERRRLRKAQGPEKTLPVIDELITRMLRGEKIP
ncbi:precorrin-2 dehydrogenase/sirohydrochlorin ferrochelatase family protein [Leadbettera azotonutricia]|uniref:precorrin-2 dehydrogenase n=1 Tax=Leadbettera azotonutricia (strain ATCC BAA-888 / DSM 13862 / ZAS-9) TaxID=545695 RepID=F5YCL3_LEAAZ|nr:bifunctional precorrin-2 dehydrogenase/sirohydrochlorin ferrochelatase [Leadbettera azotonutricia]AEF81492.1 siroheme synthase [Leadbettera azotonutricia ZAS-9]